MEVVGNPGKSSGDSLGTNLGFGEGRDIIGFDNFDDRCYCEDDQEQSSENEDVEVLGAVVDSRFGVFEL